jgi:putative transposase
MKKRRFSVERIVGALKQAVVGVPVAELIRRVVISEQTFYRWKKQYGGLESDQVRGVKWDFPRRMPQRALVRNTDRGETTYPGLAPAIQWESSSQGSRGPDAERIRQPARG